MPDALEIAKYAACEAGRILVAGRGQSQPVRALYPHDIKLQMDVDCEQLITRILKEAFPDYAVLGEESGGRISSSCPTWIIDPLDGTANYARQIPHFCTSIALQVDDRLLLGVTYDPITDELFTARAGQGARVNGEMMRVSETRELASAFMATAFPKSMQAIANVFDDMADIVGGVRKIRVMGAAALELAYIAAGRLDGYIARNLHTWDIATGVLLIQEAGGRVSRTQTGDMSWDIRADNGWLL